MQLQFLFLWNDLNLLHQLIGSLNKASHEELMEIIATVTNSGACMGGPGWKWSCEWTESVIELNEKEKKEKGPGTKNKKNFCHSPKWLLCFFLSKQ